VNPVCPYCRAEIGSGEGERLDCPGCATPHHPECFAENGGCTVFGCSKAPADEAKISVTGGDLHPAPQPAAARPFALNTGLSMFAPTPVAASPTPVASVPPSIAVPPPPPPLAGTGAPPPPMPSQAPVAPPVASDLPSILRPTSNGPSKSRVAFVLLGVFLGFFGLHNFYAGYNKKGAIQLALTILTFFYAAAISWVWAIVEVCVINRDSEGELFA